MFKNFNLKKMIKLTNQQTSALANKFYNEAKAKQELKNEAKKKELQKEYKPLYDKGIQLLKDNSTLIRQIDIILNKDTSVYLNLKQTFDQWIDNYTINRLIKDKLKEKTLNVDTIKEDIILSTIDSNSVDEIINILTKKYK
jgi:hypothetical protein